MTISKNPYSQQIVNLCKKNVLLWKELVVVYPIRFTLNLYLVKFCKTFLFYMIPHFFGYDDIKNAVIFFFAILILPHFLAKSKCLLFPKFYLLIKTSERLSIFSNYECLRLKKKTKAVIKYSGNSDFFFKLLKVLNGKLTLGTSLNNLQQRINGRLYSLSLVVLILNTYGIGVCLMYDNPFQLPYYIVCAHAFIDFMGKGKYSIPMVVSVSLCMMYDNPSQLPYHIVCALAFIDVMGKA